MEKLKKSKKTIGRLAVLLLVLTLVVSCGFENTVKKGRIRLDESITLGQAFGNYAYFDKVKWKSFKDEQGRKIVEVTGEIDMEKMFTIEGDESTLNMLEGELFEVAFLDGMLNMAGWYQNKGINVIAKGDVTEIINMMASPRVQSIRTSALGKLLRNYASDIEGTEAILADYYWLYLFDQDKEHIADLIENYLVKRYGSIDNYYRKYHEWQGYANYENIEDLIHKSVDSYNRSKQDIDNYFDQSLIMEIIYEEYRYYNDDFEKYADNDLKKYLRLKGKYMPSNEIEHIEVFLPILKLFSEGKSDEALEAYEKIAGYLTTDFKKNKSTYTCQFAIEGKSFKYFAGVWSITLAVKGASEPITFDFPESPDDLPYLRAVYSNKGFME